MLFYLIAGHFVCDYGLQSAYMADAKGKVLLEWWVSRNWLVQRMTGLESTVKASEWLWPLLAHCFIHGLAVAFITQSVTLGIFEVVMHFLIDWSKTVMVIPATADQLMHLFCKVCWWLLIIAVAVP